MSQAMVSSFWLILELYEEVTPGTQVVAVTGDMFYFVFL